MSISYEQGPRMNYLAISPWTPLRVKTLQALYTESPISMQCNKSDGSRFQVVIYSLKMSFFYPRSYFLNLFKDTNVIYREIGKVC